METTELKEEMERIEDMIGKVVMYRGRNIKVKGYVVKDDRIEIKTNGNPVITSAEKLSDTLDEFLPVSDELDSADKEKGLQVFGNNKSNLDDLEGILMENIQKVRENKDYLDQAKEINSQANSIIKIAKTKVDMVREMRKLQGS